MKKVAVIGAGITGITTAYFLAKAGFKVNVYEKDMYPAMLTSYANGGQLSVSNSEVWTTWSNIYKGIGWIFKKDAPFLVNPKPSYKKFKWIAEFINNTVSGKYEDNTVETIKLGLRARDLYLKIAEEENIQFDLTKRGILHFYKNKNYFDSAKIAAEKIYKVNGLERRILNDADEVFKVESALTDRSIIGGIYTPSDMNGDIHKFCYELYQKLLHDYDVTFIFGAEVNVEFLLSKSIVDHVVVCAGVYSQHIADKLGDKLNIYPVKGYSITVNNVGEEAPSVSLLDDEAKIVSSRLGDRFRVAGTAELNGYNFDIVEHRIKPLMNWVHKNFTDVNTRDTVKWAGLRPMTPSMLPIIKPSKVENVWYNTGHGHLGWTISAATAEIVVDMIKKEI
jgi:D-amino-acid dehydrogenase